VDIWVGLLVEATLLAITRLLGGTEAMAVKAQCPLVDLAGFGRKVRVALATSAKTHTAKYVYAASPHAHAPLKVEHLFFWHSHGRPSLSLSLFFSFSSKRLDVVFVVGCVLSLCVLCVWCEYVCKCFSLLLASGRSEGRVRRSEREEEERRQSERIRKKLPRE